MYIPVQNVNSGAASESQGQWVRVKGRPLEDNVGRVVGNKRFDFGVGNCRYVLFEDTGEVSSYREADVESVAGPT
jgi:hypothetical protein